MHRRETEAGGHLAEFADRGLILGMFATEVTRESGPWNLVGLTRDADTASCDLAGAYITWFSTTALTSPRQHSEL